MTDDPEEIRAAARKVSALAIRARQEAQHVTTQSAVHWSSVAADRYRDRLADRAADFMSRAADLDALAHALLAHARHVEDHEQAIARAAKILGGDVTAIIHDAEGLVSDAVRLAS
ncbi:hypothetical protein [Leekyejoonella antrihumi]|uniref:Uncharacterized protein n=1 Tax=Leekyejoonella antrihumi TaxID=1660198 RepID=A0A563E6C6_9MICO|nr:hypothetical protein [Leekyejoonella antrihumi]TWP37985.1 hypothetical protein FGL98_04560 [Leekyejoonella antrihumi]